MAFYEELVQQLNEKSLKQYEEGLVQLQALQKELSKSNDVFDKFALKITQNLLFYADLEKEFHENFYKQKSVEELQKLNLRLYGELKPGSYAESYANPDHTVKLFGDELGKIFAAYYTNLRQCIKYATTNKIFAIQKKISQFLKLHKLLKQRSKDVSSYKKIVNSLVKELQKENTQINILEQFSIAASHYEPIVMKADLSNEKYLYQYCKNITENEIQTAAFLREYPAEKIETLVKSMVKAYYRGFEHDGKDISKKETVKIIYNIGQERIIRELTEKLREKGLEPVLTAVRTTEPNKQYSYDHRFDNALYFEQEFIEKLMEHQKQVIKTCSEPIEKLSGNIYFEKFGEKPFKPVQKKSCLKLSSEQQKLSQHFKIYMNNLYQQYMPRSEISFSIIGFPLPEIGEHFREIFEDTLQLNMIDTEHHEKIQQHIVDVLDKADFVHVKGKKGNKTDILVKMQELQDPHKHTNFENCGADVNIPVGEVFTSPKLNGTNGVFHVKETYIAGLRYEDLMMKFKDGYVEYYSCSNFEDEEDNRNYIKENILFPHDTLPMGEFAIGTNTLAYVMAEKYQILAKMPVLIVEKMGPHFAVGDTCYSWQEDTPIYNPIDGKEITARENEHSARRKEDIQKAYTNCHTDVTLPYEELEFISVITKNDKRIDIIKDGRFVVPGTEELNEPLEDWEQKQKR